MHGIRTALEKQSAKAAKRNGSQADYDAAFSAGYAAGARAYARSPGTISAADGKRAYGRVSRKYGSDWVTGYAAAIDAARGAYGMPGASRAAALGLTAKRNPAAKRPTFAVAQAAILDALAADGWSVVRNLKVPHATKQRVRLWFKTQAVYSEKLGPSYWNERFDFGAARSLHVPDIRDISPAKFAAFADKL